jgi:superfamily II DNA or RNA helicase
MHRAINSVIDGAAWASFPRSHRREIALRRFDREGWVAVLRDYQRIVDEFERLVAGGARSVLVAAPTGSGKTVIAAAIVAAAVAPSPQLEQCNGVVLQ